MIGADKRQPSYMVDGYARHCAALMIDWCRTEFKLHCRQQTVWNPKIYTSFNSRQTRSHGGLYANFVPGMRLALAYSSHNNRTFPEYPRYADDPEIGTVVCKTWQLKVALTVAHEMAHIVQYSLAAFVNPLQWDDKLFNMWGLACGNEKVIFGHGPFFQHIYRKIRNKFINGKGLIPIAEPDYAALQQAAMPVRKRPLPAAIGRVEIKDGFNRHRHVHGIFDLAEKTKTTKNGPVVSILYKGRVLRIKLTGESVVRYI